MQVHTPFLLLICLLSVYLAGSALNLREQRNKFFLLHKMQAFRLQNPCSEARFLSLSPGHVFAVKGCPVQCRIFPGLYPLGARSIQPPVVTTENISRHCQMPPRVGVGGAKAGPWLRTTAQYAARPGSGTPPSAKVVLVLPSRLVQCPGILEHFMLMTTGVCGVLTVF